MPKKPVVLVLPEHKITAQVVSELKRTLRAHPGDSPVRLKVEGREKTVIYELGFLVNPEHIASEIKGSFGQSAWAGIAA